MSENTQELLEHHWAMDEVAAAELASRLEMHHQGYMIEAAVEPLDPVYVARRDINRKLLGDVFSGKGKAAFILGACSQTAGVDNGRLFDLIDELQEEFPIGEPDSSEGTIFGTRENGGKPRSALKTRGLAFSTDPEERQAFFNHHLHAFSRGIPTMTEAVGGPHLATVAPYISGDWMGTRNVLDTELRDILSLIKLPAALKNSQSGRSIDVECAITTIRAGSDEKDGSGADLGSIGRSLRYLTGIDPGVLRVSSGNRNVAIIARGFELPENMSPESRKVAAFKHLSELCSLAKKMGSVVLLDGSHDVPRMFDLEPSDQTRFVRSTHEINMGIREGRVTDGHLYKGNIHEIGVARGQTDVDFLIETDKDAELVKSVVRETLEAIDSIKHSN